MDLDILKKNYNKVLAREKKARGFFDTATVAEAEKWLPEYTKLTMELSRMMVHYKKITGECMTNDEIFEGFKI